MPEESLAQSFSKKRDASGPAGGAGLTEEAGPPGDTGSPSGALPPLADLWRRVLARVIDYLLVGIPVYGLLLVYSRTHVHGLGRIWQLLFSVLVYIGYDGYMLTTRGQTFGKQWMKIRVGMLHDGSLPVGRAGWLRAAVYALPWLFPYPWSYLWLINVLWVLWDKPYRQALHDKAAKTAVVTASRA